MSDSITKSSESSQSCATCIEFRESTCRIWQKRVQSTDGSDCIAFLSIKGNEMHAVADRSEEIVRLWEAFQQSQNRKSMEPHLVPLFTTGDDRTFNHAFERFCDLTQGNPKAIPLFLTLPDVDKPDLLPSQLVLEITRLNELASIKGRLFTEVPKGGWAHLLLEICFPKSLARFHLNNSDGEASEVLKRQRHVLRELLDPKIARGTDKNSENQQDEFCELNQDAIRKAEWEALFGDSAEGGVAVNSQMAIGALSALVELHGTLDVLLLDDLMGRSADDASNAHDSLLQKLKALEPLIKVSAPVLPVLQHHENHPDELLPLIEAEILKLSRPLAAIVDLNWVFADTSVRSPRFGLELIRLIRKTKPSLPIFVWSPMRDKSVLQRAMQLGASSYFDKEEALTWRHEERPEEATLDVSAAKIKPEEWAKFQRRELQSTVNNLLTFGKLWFRVLQWEATRYRMPPVETYVRSFLLDETRETRKERQKFLKIFGLSEAKLLNTEKPDVERLLRALLPEADQVEILRFFGEGRSGSEPPFIVRGKTASGRWLRPVQIKISRDWRALAREGKGYRDVFAGALGPSVAHVEAGPYRLNDWTGMCQSFAAPEEAIREIGTKSTRSLSEWLRKNLCKPEVCRQLVNELFDGVLDPFYKDNLTRREESVVRAFDRVSPAHLETMFAPVLEEKPKTDDIDLTPENLSRKNEKSRREAAYREWQKLEEWYAKREKGTSSIAIWGLVIDTLEVDDADPKEWRLRLLDSTLGIKIDLKAGDQNVAGRWKSLAESPIKLRGLPVAFELKRGMVQEAVNGNGRVLEGWGRSVRKRLTEAGLKDGILEWNGDITDAKKQDETRLDQITSFFYPIHPLDWSEEFHVGPTHGDLNLGNILLHQKGDSYFPWLIDFDKAEMNRPVVFDLAKLEIEAYHKIGQELYFELAEMGCLGENSDKRDQNLQKLLRDFENCLEKDGIERIDHLWHRFVRGVSIPESLRLRFEGFFAYLRQVHRRVFDLGINQREFLIGRAVYCFCCIKFKHLYETKSHPNAPFPAKLLFWKLVALLDALDRTNGIPEAGKNHNSHATLILDTLKKVRGARCKGSTNPASTLLGADEQKWTAIFKALREESLPGKRYWFREVLWHARDHGVARTTEALAAFTRAITIASAKNGKIEDMKPERVDYASTGRLGNVFPTREMLRVLAKTNQQLVKMSTRGDSGGTIDILEHAGVPLCENASAVDAELNSRGWAVATACRDICEVDKILWGLRKQTNCMKVADLVIASISAKKLSLGIGTFKVEVASGYDAKILQNRNDLSSLSTLWADVWKEASKKSEGNPNNGSVECSEFNTDKIQSWFNETVGDTDSGKLDMVIVGSALLAANIWRLNPTWQPKLRLRMPSKFCVKMDLYAGLLERIKIEAQTTDFQTISDTKLDSLPVIFRLDDINHPPHLRRVFCWATEDFALDCEEMRDIRAVFYRFDDSSDIREGVVIEFFDDLYSNISKRSESELTSFVFGQSWLAMLLPKTMALNSEFASCWRVLRNGFAQEVKAGK